MSQTAIQLKVTPPDAAVSSCPSMDKETEERHGERVSKENKVLMKQAPTLQPNKLPLQPHQPKQPSSQPNPPPTPTLTTMTGRTGAGGAGSRGAGAPRASGTKKTGTKKTAREAAPKGVEKKVAKTPVKAVSEKVAAAKEKAKAKKEAQKASHDERREAYSLTEKSGDRTAEKKVSQEKRATRGLRE